MVSLRMLPFEPGALEDFQGGGANVPFLGNVYVICFLFVGLDVAL